MITIVGSFILAAGALFGIWLGAYYAAGRLGAQLDTQARWLEGRRVEESQRFDAQLEAEAKRLERQLEHDRSMRDRDELRQTFDEATAVMEKAVVGMSELLASAGVLKLINRSVHDHILTSSDPVDPREGVMAAAYGMGGQHHRLRLRLYEHEITEQYWKVRQGIISILDEPSLGDSERTEEKRKEILKRADEIRKDAGIFVRMAYEHIGGAVPAN